MRPKRTVRTSGVGHSLGASRPILFRCLCCGRRNLPRDAIAHIGVKPWNGMVAAFCGECWRSGRVWRGPWVVEMEMEKKSSHE